MVKGFKLSKCLLFVDDLKLFKTLKNVLAASDLQRDLDALSSWCQHYRLYLNYDKCKCMSLRRTAVKFGYMNDSITLTRVTNIRDLCLIFDQNMLFAIQRLYCLQSLFYVWFYDENLLRVL